MSDSNPPSPPLRARALLFEPGSRVSSRRDLAGLVFKHLGFAIAAFASVMTLATAFIYLTPPLYEAKAKVLVERGKQPTQRADLAQYPLEAFEVIMSEIEILRSRTVAEQVVDSLGLVDRPLKPSIFRTISNGISSALDTLGLLKLETRREKLIRVLLRALRVEPAPQSSVLLITYRAESPTDAAEITRAVTDAYLIHHRRIYADNTREFYERRVKATGDELSRLGEELRRETDPSQKERLLLEVSAVEKSYLLFHDRLNAARAAQEADESLVNVRVVDYPTVPVRPTRSRLLLMIVAFVAGSVLAISLAMVREYFDQGIYSARDFDEYFDLTVLGTVCFVATGLPDEPPGLMTASLEHEQAASPRHSTGR